MRTVTFYILHTYLCFILSSLKAKNSVWHPGLYNIIVSHSEINIGNTKCKELHIMYTYTSVNIVICRSCNGESERTVLFSHVQLELTVLIILSTYIHHNHACKQYMDLLTSLITITLKFWGWHWVVAISVHVHVVNLSDAYM